MMWRQQGLSGDGRDGKVGLRCAAQHGTGRGGVQESFTDLVVGLYVCIPSFEGLNLRFEGCDREDLGGDFEGWRGFEGCVVVCRRLIWCMAITLKGLYCDNHATDCRAVFCRLC